MIGTKGYYSLIQFCPDLSRLETVNVGVVLFCPALHFLGTRLAKSNQRARQLCKGRAVNWRSLSSAKQAVEQHLASIKESFTSLEDFQRFVDSRGNNLIMTRPRSIKVFDPEKDLDALFSELVGEDRRRATQSPVFPKLESLFQELKAEGRAELDVKIEIPIVERPLRVPYSYRNGIVNFVKPHNFSSEEGDAIRSAMQFALEGDLIKRYGKENDQSKELIIVSSFAADSGDRGIEKRVRQVLDEYRVKTIGESEIDSFAAKVRRDAHN